MKPLLTVKTTNNLELTVLTLFLCQIMDVGCLSLNYYTNKQLSDNNRAQRQIALYCNMGM